MSFKLTDANMGREGAPSGLVKGGGLLEGVRLEGKPLGCGDCNMCSLANGPTFVLEVSFDMFQMHDSNFPLGLSPQGLHSIAGKPGHIEQPGANNSHLAVFLKLSRAVSQSGVHVWPQWKEVTDTPTSACRTPLCN